MDMKAQGSQLIVIFRGSEENPTTSGHLGGKQTLDHLLTFTCVYHHPSNKAGERWFLFVRFCFVPKFIFYLLNITIRFPKITQWKENK